MLWIKGEKSNVTWHVGDSIPEQATKRVVTFQADGHELEMILLAMERGVLNERGEVVFKPRRRRK